MDHLSSEVEQQPKKQHISWRRERVLELSSQGRTEREIATMLRVGAGTVGRDLAYLNKQARENLRYHVQERLPSTHQKCSNGLNQVLKMAWNIVLLDFGNNTTRIQALSLISDCYKYIMDLTTNGAIVTDAIKYVTQKQEQIDTLHKLDERIEATGEEAEQEETTTNGIF